MISIEEYIKLKELPIDDSIPELNARNTGTRIRYGLSHGNIKTFGDLFDNLNSIIYLRQVGAKGRDSIYGMIARYLQIEDQMPNVGLLINGFPTENPKLKFIQSVIEKLESEKIQFENSEIEKLVFYKGLVSSGIQFLSSQSAENFKVGSKEQTQIAKSVERYLNFLTQQLLKEKKSKEEIEQIIQSKMDEYKKIVEIKRDELKFGGENAGFLSQMAAKIGEVRKYKRNTKTHKEEKEHNPFYNDGQTI